MYARVQQEEVGRCTLPSVDECEFIEPKLLLITLCGVLVCNCLYSWVMIAIYSYLVQ